MKREVILLRHAHAEAGQKGQADADRPLSARGVDEVEMRRLTALKIDSVITDVPDRMVALF